MRKPATLAALTLTAAAVLLAGCGSADDASTEASADTVEMPADSALSPVSDAPVADPSATATDAPEDVPEPGAVAAGEDAADVAAEAEAAATPAPGE